VVEVPKKSPLAPLYRPEMQKLQLPLSLVALSSKFHGLLASDVVTMRIASSMSPEMESFSGPPNTAQPAPTLHVEIVYKQIHLP
jgi:hypothetical protein